jgi:hypothetical protein
MAQDAVDPKPGHGTQAETKRPGPGDENAKEARRLDPAKAELHGQDPEEVAERMGTTGKALSGG